MTNRRPGLIKRILIDIAGFALVLLSLLTGWLPGPGGIPLFLAGMALLATNHRWASRLLHHVKRHGSNLADLIFRDHELLKLIYDIVAVGVIVLIIIVIGSVTHSVLKGALIWLGFLSLVALVMNRRRAQRFKRFVLRSQRP